MKCVFCEIGRSKEVENTILYENKYFYIIPAKGPLVSGHVLIVDKNHSTSLMSIDSIIKASFINIITEIIAMMPSYKGFLFFEHGSYKNEKGGKTIDHTHIHVLPGFSEKKEILEANFIIERRLKLNEVQNEVLNYAYLLIGDINGVFIYNGVSVDSQIIRTKIATTNHNLVPYWQDYDNKQCLEDTIKMWKDVKF